MTCHELTDFLLDYVSGELPDTTRAEFERHLGICPDCRRYLDGYRTTIAMSKAAFAAPPAVDADEVPEELVAAILKAKCGR
jgi:anti-sigma factor RsiW